MQPAMSIVAAARVKKRDGSPLRSLAGSFACA
jgi:hypothetical protein